MKTHIARSIFETQTHLESALRADQQQRDQGLAWISSQFQTKLQTCLAQLRQRNGELAVARNQLEIIQGQRRKQIAELSRQVRDFYQVLRRRNQREGLGEELELLHGRPRLMPQSATPSQWLQWAKNIVNGEERALQQGFPQMVNPSAADLNQFLKRAAASETQWAERMQAFKARELALRQTREQATRNLRGLAMRLREVLAHETPTTRRELMRTYGFSFISTGAKDRSKGKAGSSQLANLIPPQLPTLPEDSDQAETSQAQPAAPASPKPSSAPEPPKPSPAPEPQQATAQPLPQTETRDQQLKTAAAKQTEEPPQKKLSRRQKKALRRAQQTPNPQDTFTHTSQATKTINPGNLPHLGVQHPPAGTVPTPILALNPPQPQ